MPRRGAPVAPLIAVVLAAVSMSAQQGAPRRASSPRVTDAASAVFELSNSLGILRSVQQQDSIITLEHRGKGTLTLGTRRYDVPEYRMSVNYAVPGMRVDFTRASAGAAPERSIHVVSGASAWNESSPGIGAVAEPSALKARLVALWTTPMGVAKAARAAGASARVLAREPGTNDLVFTLPPPVDDVTVTATLRTDAGVLASPHPNALKGLVGTYVMKVVTAGAVASETTYSEYGDWNWTDYRADIFLPRRMVRRMGDSVLEITTTETNTYNPYVVMPVPESVKVPAGQR